MRVAVVAGPDPGHAFPAIALSLALIQAGDDPILYTGTRWVEAARAAGVEAEPLKGLAPRPGDDDLDAGARIHSRAAYISTELLPDLKSVSRISSSPTSSLPEADWPPNDSASPGWNFRLTRCTHRRGVTADR
ncbi:hypothetical protein GCM10020255_076240 [Rhodococcus baikonurensis]